MTEHGPANEHASVGAAFQQGVRDAHADVAGSPERQDARTVARLEQERAAREVQTQALLRELGLPENSQYPDELAAFRSAMEQKIRGLFDPASPSYPKANSAAERMRIRRVELTKAAVDTKKLLIKHVNRLRFGEGPLAVARKAIANPWVKLVTGALGVIGSLSIPKLSLLAPAMAGGSVRMVTEGIRQLQSGEGAARKALDAAHDGFEAKIRAGLEQLTLSNDRDPAAIGRFIHEFIDGVYLREMKALFSAQNGFNEKTQARVHWQKSIAAKGAFGALALGMPMDIDGLPTLAGAMKGGSLDQHFVLGLNKTYEAGNWGTIGLLKGNIGLKLGMLAANLGAGWLGFKGSEWAMGWAEGRSARLGMADGAAAPQPAAQTSRSTEQPAAGGTSHAPHANEPAAHATQSPATTPPAPGSPLGGLPGVPTPPSPPAPPAAERAATSGEVSFTMEDVRNGTVPAFQTDRSAPNRVTTAAGVGAPKADSPVDSGEEVPPAPASTPSGAPKPAATAPKPAPGTTPTPVTEPAAAKPPAAPKPATKAPTAGTAPATPPPAAATPAAEPARPAPVAAPDTGGGGAVPPPAPAAGPRPPLPATPSGPLAPAPTAPPQPAPAPVAGAEAPEVTTEPVVVDEEEDLVEEAAGQPTKLTVKQRFEAELVRTREDAARPTVEGRRFERIRRIHEREYLTKPLPRIPLRKQHPTQDELQERWDAIDEERALVRGTMTAAALAQAELAERVKAQQRPADKDPATADIHLAIEIRDRVQQLQRQRRYLNQPSVHALIGELSNAIEDYVELVSGQVRSLERSGAGAGVSLTTDEAGHAWAVAGEDEDRSPTDDKPAILRSWQDGEPERVPPVAAPAPEPMRPPAPVRPVRRILLPEPGAEAAAPAGEPIAADEPEVEPIEDGQPEAAPEGGAEPAQATIDWDAVVGQVMHVGVDVPVTIDGPLSDTRLDEAVDADTLTPDGWQELLEARLLALRQAFAFAEANPEPELTEIPAIRAGIERIRSELVPALQKLAEANTDAQSAVDAAVAQLMGGPDGIDPYDAQLEQRLAEAGEGVAGEAEANPEAKVRETPEQVLDRNLTQLRELAAAPDLATVDQPTLRRVLRELLELPEQRQQEAKAINAALRALPANLVFEVGGASYELASVKIETVLSRKQQRFLKAFEQSMVDDYVVEGLLDAKFPHIALTYFEGAYDTKDRARIAQQLSAQVESERLWLDSGVDDQSWGIKALLTLLGTKALGPNVLFTEAFYNDDAYAARQSRRTLFSRAMKTYERTAKRIQAQRLESGDQAGAELAGQVLERLKQVRNELQTAKQLDARTNRTRISQPMSGNFKNERGQSAGWLSEQRLTDVLADATAVRLVPKSD